MLFGNTIVYPRNPAESKKKYLRIFEYTIGTESEHVEYHRGVITLKFTELLLSVESSSAKIVLIKVTGGIGETYFMSSFDLLGCNKEYAVSNDLRTDLANSKYS